MSSTTGESRPGHAELAALKHLALAGARSGTAKVSCAGLAEDLDASTQTASRRLQALEDTGYVERELVSDGQLVSLTDAGVQALEREFEDYRRIFESPAGLELAGTVTGGMGEGRHYISLSGYMAQFRERLGYEPFPGTLNVDLAPDARRSRSALSALDAVPIDGWEDDERTYGPAVCYPVRVGHGDDVYDGAHLIVPERTHHDEDQVEVIAPDKLRDELGLEDGDEVTLRVGN